MKNNDIIPPEKLHKLQKWAKKLCREMKEPKTFDEKLKDLQTFINLTKILNRHTSLKINSRLKLLENTEKSKHELKISDQN